MTNDPDRSSRKDLAPRYSDPFSALRAEMDSLFDSFMGGLPAFSGMFGTSGGRGFTLTPHVDVKETDKEIVVEAELPGMDEKDISLAVKDGVLTHREDSPTASTRGNEKFGPSGVQTYRVLMQTAGGFVAADVDAATGDEAAEKGLAQHLGAKVTNVSPAPQKKAG